MASRSVTSAIRVHLHTAEACAVEWNVFTFHIRMSEPTHAHYSILYVNAHARTAWHSQLTTCCQPLPTQTFYIEPTYYLHGNKQHSTLIGVNVCWGTDGFILFFFNAMQKVILSLQTYLFIFTCRESNAPNRSSIHNKEYCSKPIIHAYQANLLSLTDFLSTFHSSTDWLIT